MRLSMLPLLVLCVGCQSFEGEYRLTNFSQGAGRDLATVAGESGSLSVSKGHMGMLDVELPIEGTEGETWYLSCTLDIPEEEQTNFDPNCEVEITDSEGLLAAGVYPVEGVAYMNTTHDGDRTNFHFSPDSDDMLPLYGFYRFTDQ